MELYDRQAPVWHCYSPILRLSSILRGQVHDHRGISPVSRRTDCLYELDANDSTSSDISLLVVDEFLRAHAANSLVSIINTDSISLSLAEISCRARSQLESLLGLVRVILAVEISPSRSQSRSDGDRGRRRTAERSQSSSQSSSLPAHPPATLN